MSFADLGISKSVVRALAERGIHEPFPIQEWRSPMRSPATTSWSSRRPGSARRSPSGSDRRPGRAGPRHRGPGPWRPTRELASQIGRRAGVDLRHQAAAHRRRLRRRRLRAAIAAARKADVVVATPGRLEDLSRPRSRFAEAGPHPRLDEADRMLDMGFSRRSTGSSPRPRRAPDARSSRRRSRAPPASSPPSTRARPAATPTPPRSTPRRHRAQLRPRRHPHAKFERLTEQLARRRARTHRSSFVRTNAAPTAWSSACARTNWRPSRCQRQSGAARTGARPLRARRCRHPGRDRRRRPRHRRRRSHARDHFDMPGDGDVLHAPHRPHRPRREPRRRH